MPRAERLARWDSLAPASPDGILRDQGGATSRSYLGAGPKCAPGSPRAKVPELPLQGGPLEISSRKKKTKRTQTPRGFALPREGSWIRGPRRKSRAEALKSGWTPGQRGRENAPLEKDFPPKTISPTVPTSSRQGRAGALNCLDPHRGGLTGTWTREHARRAPAAGIAGIPSTTPRPGRLGRPLLPEQAPRHLLAMRF